MGVGRKDGASCWGEERERERHMGGKFLEVQMEMWACDRASFHECLLKAPSGRGHSRISQSVPIVACLLRQCPSIILAWCVELSCST